eukprot:Nitzschia sp. Nitz4//scaffold210_size37948//12164//13177//NITZ4_007688-RA/size37948-processed-gene-0.48-mRNA-1//-1//CDS//3329541924//5938//frame0
MIAPSETDNSHPELSDISKLGSKAQRNDEDYLSGSEDLSTSAQSSMMLHKNGKQRVMVPGPGDVLLGRGKPFQSHQGNQFMLQLVDQFRTGYLKSDRKGKHLIIEQVLGFIKERGGRFLMRVDYENYWVEVKRSISYRKVGHAFRSKARRLKKVDPPSSAPTVVKHPGNSVGNSQSILPLPNVDRDMVAMNQIGNSVMGTGMSSSNPLLRLPGRLAPTNLRQQDIILNELIAMERMGAQQDALAMRRQLQGNSQSIGHFGGMQGNPSLGRFTNNMDDLLLLERMQQQGRSNQVNSPNTTVRRLPSNVQGGGVLGNNTNVFNSSMGGGQSSMFPGQLY